MAGFTGGYVPGPRSATNRGTEHFNPGVGYAGGAENDPNFWATDADYNQYVNSQSNPTNQLPSVKGLVAATTGPGITGNVQSVGPNGDVSQVQTTPYAQTNIYQTDPNAGGTKVASQGSLTQPGFENQQQTQLEGTLKSSQMTQAAKLQADAEARRLGYIKTLTGSQSPEVAGQGGPAFDENAARAAAFGRAKEQAGQTALSSLKALNDVMASQGLTGSSQEASGVANIIGGGTGAVNDFTRTQLMQDLNRAADIADRNQQNKITQRGQNMSQIPSLVSLLTSTGGAY